MSTRLAGLALVTLVCAVSGCRGPVNAPADAPPVTEVPADGPTVADDPADAVDAPPPPPPAYETALPESVRAIVSEEFTGDFDQMVTRRLIRVGTPFNRTSYFVDKGVQRGVAYEMGLAFEQHLNKQLKTKSAKRVNVFFIALPRDQMQHALTEGKVDLVTAQITVRPELQAIVDFTRPTRTNVSEVVVSGPGAPALASVDDLSGKEVCARKDSSAWESLVALNESLKTKGLPPVVIREVPGNLEDDDLLEMVHAGLIPMVVVQDYLAEFWKKIFKDLTIHDRVAVRTGASLAVAIRKNSPLLAAELNGFLAKYGLGTAFGNMIEERYLASTRFVRRASAEAERKKFLDLVAIFQKYSDRYQMDYLLMAAQGYQESRLDHGARSPVGAIGVMQVMPATGKELNVGDITQVDPNIHAGVKYMRFMIDEYLEDEPMDDLNKILFAFAAYNAGPNRIRKLRTVAAKRGLDPNVWFGNVEQIVSERIGRETVTYVSNIYKYYVAYLLMAEERARREEAKGAIRSDAR